MLFKEFLVRRFLVVYGKWIAVGGTLFVLAISWFLAVCSEWHMESCKDCGAFHEYLSTKVLGWEVHRETLHPKLNASWLTRRETCGHERADHWIKHRYWGLVLCCCPCQNGINRIVQRVPPINKEVATSENREAAQPPKT